MNNETSRKNILIVDDDEETLRFLCKIVEKEGLVSRPVKSARLGLKALSKWPADLILLDIRMPDINGFEFCKLIKSDDLTKHIPILFISGLEDEKDKLLAFRIGAADYITKPFYAEEVIARVNTQLSMIEMNKKLEGKIEFGIEQLQRQQERLLNVINLLNAYVFSIDENNAISYANSGLKDIFEEELIGKLWYREIFGVELVPDWFPENKVLEEQAHFQVEVLNTKLSRWFNIVLSGTFDETGSLTEKQFILHDITESKENLIKLKEREKQLDEENAILKKSMTERFKFGELIGKSKVMQDVYELIISAAASNANVIIYGESGTGKELVAREIHRNSNRKNQSMVYVNCGAIPENLIESEFFGHKKGAFTGADKDRTGYLKQADKGVLFLDEIGEISLNMQVKLLRAIEGGGYTQVGGVERIQTDIRIIAATNKNLLEEVNKGNMRSDFFYRIHVIPLEIPPLRDREEDIALLIDHIWKKERLNKSQHLEFKEKEQLLRYNWPGNVRELENTIKRYATMNQLDFVHSTPEEEMKIMHEQDYLSNSSSLNSIVENVEKQAIKLALEKHYWRKGDTAKYLKIDPKTLAKKIIAYKIKKGITSIEISD